MFKKVFLLWCLLLNLCSYNFCCFILSLQHFVEADIVLLCNNFILRIYFIIYTWFSYFDIILQFNIKTCQERLDWSICGGFERIASLSESSGIDEYDRAPSLQSVFKRLKGKFTLTTHFLTSNDFQPFAEFYQPLFFLLSFLFYLLSTMSFQTKILNCIFKILVLKPMYKVEDKRL